MFSMFVCIGCLLNREEHLTLQDQLRDTSSFEDTSTPDDVEDTADTGEHPTINSTHYALFNEHGCIEFDGDASPLLQDSWSFSLRLTPDLPTGPVPNTMFQVGRARMMIKEDIQDVKLFFCPELPEGETISDVLDFNSLCVRYDVSQNLQLENGDRITISYVDDTLRLFTNDSRSASFGEVENSFLSEGVDTNKLFFGCATRGEQDRLFDNYWKGGVDALILFDHGLMIDEVQELYEAEQNNALMEFLIHSDAIAHWNLGEDEMGHIGDTFQLRNGEATNIEFKEYTQDRE